VELFYSLSIRSQSYGPIALLLVSVDRSCFFLNGAAPIFAARNLEHNISEYENFEMRYSGAFTNFSGSSTAYLRSVNRPTVIREDKYLWRGTRGAVSTQRFLHRSGR